jgi:hypothetical protein
LDSLLPKKQEDDAEKYGFKFQLTLSSGAKSTSLNEF